MMDKSKLRTGTLLVFVYQLTRFFKGVPMVLLSVGNSEPTKVLLQETHSPGKWENPLWNKPVKLHPPVIFNSGEKLSLVEEDTKLDIQICIDTESSICVENFLEFPIASLSRGIPFRNKFELEGSKLEIGLQAVDFGEIALPKLEVPDKIHQNYFRGIQNSEKKFSEIHEAKQSFVEISQIKPLQITRKKKVGKGRFAKVYRGKVSGLKGEVAIKDISTESEIAYMSWIKEIEIMSMLTQSNYVITLYGYSFTEKYLTIVMEFFPNSLYNILYKLEVPLHPFNRLRLSLHVIRGILYLHSCGIIHCDIKSSNILVSQDLSTCKICDFGFSEVINADFRTTIPSVGTTLWMAPEVKTGEPPTTSSDIYSSGVVLYEIFTNTLPTNILDNGNAEFTKQFFGNSVALPCLDLNPNLRPNSEELLRNLDLFTEEFIWNLFNLDSTIIEKAGVVRPVSETSNLDWENSEKLYKYLLKHKPDTVKEIQSNLILSDSHGKNNENNETPKNREPEKKLGESTKISRRKSEKIRERPDTLSPDVKKSDVRKSETASKSRDNSSSSIRKSQDLSQNSTDFKPKSRDGKVSPQDNYKLRESSSNSDVRKSHPQRTSHSDRKRDDERTARDSERSPHEKKILDRTEESESV